MGSGTSWGSGLALLRDRQARLPDALRAAVESAFPSEDARRAFGEARAVVTTGVGSSLAHARFLAWLLRSDARLPAWDVPTGAFVEPPGPEASEQTLVVFSQGLSPNARLPLKHVDRYRAVVLVTAAAHDSPDRAAVALAAAEAGVLVVPMPCAPEYEVLLRLIGPAVGFVSAVRLARSAGARLDLSAEACAASATRAAERARTQFASVATETFADPISFVATDGYATLAHNLSAKVLEGMFLPWPNAVDVFELAHGALQEAYGKHRTFVALARGGTSERTLFERVRSTLEPQHRWIELEASTRGPLAILEHEVMLNELVLAAIEHRKLDQRNWPGKDRDAPLYSIGSIAELAL